MFLDFEFVSFFRFLLRRLEIMSSSETNRCLSLQSITRCLEEGAEEFIVKPVKLSDVKRLKSFVMKGEGKEDKEITTCKRKCRDETTPFTSSLSPPLLPSSPAPISCNNIISPQQQPASAPSPSLPDCSIKRPRLQHAD